MTSRRSADFRQVAIHRRAAGEPAEAELAQRKLTFSELLKRRHDVASARPAPAPARPSAPDAPSTSRTDCAEPEADGVEADESEEAPGDARDVPRRDAGEAPPQAFDPPPDETPGQALAGPGDDPDWAAKLMPSGLALDDMMFGLHAASHAARIGDDAPHPVALALARTISQFCNEPAVDDSEGWHVRMPLRADVLPETTLDLSISSYWLQLRFETTSVASRELVLTHRAALVTLLESNLNRRREIAISVD